MLRVALVGGPMYDGVYELLPDDADVVVHADHPSLNRAVAELLGRGERLDVISTHGKYAPSQAAWLHPLDDLLPESLVAAAAPRAVDLCRFDGTLLCLPRNIDVRVLWFRRDRVDIAPDTWSDLAASGHSFGFTGRESGLFGLFFELVVGEGGSLFAAGGRPTMTGAVAEAAVARLCELAAGAPDDLPEWHYDEVDQALIDGRVSMAAAWPGGTARLRGSAIGDWLAPAAYPAGSVQRVSYSGCHAWAIPSTCADVERSVEVVARLASAEAARLEAAAGGIPARSDVLDALEPLNAVDAARLAVTRATIADSMITYPPLARFPEVEDAGWSALNLAIRGEASAADAVAQIQSAAEAALLV